MKALRSIVYFILLAALAFAIWWYFFPPPERVIKTRLKHLAALISSDVSGSNIKRVANINRVIGYFSSDVVIRADAVSRYSEVISGRDSLMQGLMGARSQLQRVEAQFYNIEPQVDPSKTNATVLLTALVRIDDQEDPFLGEVKLKMRKSDGTWLITSVEPLKTDFR